MMRLYNSCLELFCPCKPHNSVLAVSVKNMQTLTLPETLPSPTKLNEALHPHLEGAVFVFVSFLANSEAGRKGEIFYFLFNQLS